MIYVLELRKCGRYVLKGHRNYFDAELYAAKLSQDSAYLIIMPDLHNVWKAVRILKPLLLKRINGSR